MSQELTSVTDMINTGTGKILANLREAPMPARDKIEQVLDSLVEAGFSCILEVGEPNNDILGIQVGRDKLGIAVIGGTNPMAYVPVSYTHLRAHETRHDLVCRLLLE